MSETVGQAVERVERVSDMLSAQAGEFAKVLPGHIGADRFTRWALTVLRKPELAEVMQTSAGQLSVMSALMDCASLGLEPGRTYHLLPFGGREKDGTPKPKTVAGVTDYKGEIQLITNANPDASVIAMLVREHDDFHLTGANTPPAHNADWFGDRGPIVGGYAFVQYPQGRCSLVVRMSEADFLKHRAKSRKQDLWDEWPEPFRVKTLVHQLRKTEPWSAERKGYR
jgi:phage RecT family recombinase